MVVGDVVESHRHRHRHVSKGNCLSAYYTTTTLPPHPHNQLIASPVSTTRHRRAFLSTLHTLCPPVTTSVHILLQKLLIKPMTKKTMSQMRFLPALAQTA